ncbi:MAG: TIR domain-containing protein [Betaproteobacteria bacterium]
MQKKYWAFLSYSHQDTRVCEWLHLALESFRVPKRLLGRSSRDGVIPGRLFPIFRDRDELPGSSELGRNLTDALADSRYLIVVCSPAAARSRWVNEEIRQFKAMGGEGRILALIVDGEPNAADKPDSGLLECFPEALKRRVDGAGNLTADRVEPIAADIRKGRESKSIALLRLIAGLLGIPFDELRQRDRERNRRSFAFRFATLATIAMLVAGGGIWKYRQNRMERLEDLGREAMMQEQPVNAAVFLAETYRMGNDSRDVRIMLEQAMRSVDMLSAVHAEDQDGIAHAMFSDDGTRIIASSKTGNVSIWRADNGNRLLRIEAAKGDTRRALFLPDSREVALLYDDGRVEVVDAKLATPIRQARLPFEIASAKLGVTDDTRFAIVDEKAGAETIIYDLRLMQVVQEITPPCRIGRLVAKNLYCLREGAGGNELTIHPLGSTATPRQLPVTTKMQEFAVDSKGKKGAIALANDELRVIDLQTGKTLAQARHPGGLRSVKFSPDGQAVATTSWAGSVLIWSSTSGQLLTNMSAHVGRVKDFHFLPDSNRFVTAGEDGFLKIWNVQTGAVLSTAHANHGFLTYTSLSPDGKQIATFSIADGVQNLAAENLDPALKVWSLDETGPTASFGNGNAATWTFFDERKSKILFASTGSPGTNWDTSTGKKLSEIPAYSGRGEVVFSRDGNAVATPQGVFDVATGRQMLAFAGPSNTPCCVAWSRDGKLVGSGSENSFRVWDVASGALAHEMAVESSYPSAAFSPDGNRVAVITRQGAMLFDVRSGMRLAEYRDKIDSAWGVEATADGTRFRIGTRDSVVEIDALTAEELGREHNRPFMGALSVCNHQLNFMSRGDKSILVSDLKTGQTIATLSAPDTALSTFDCNADGEHYVTGGRSGSAILWNAKTSKPLMRFSGHMPGRIEVGFLPLPGQVLVGGARDGIATKWTYEEEGRHFTTIARRIACRVPLALDGYTLKSRQIDRDACLRERAW